jgi:glycosyltransferase involved in cell wall biosynthesis
VVHGHQWIAGLAAAAAVREHRVPLVQTFHSLAAMRLRGLGGVVPDSVERRMVLERVLGRAVDAAVAQSEDEAAELTRMGLPRSSVVVAPAGVDTELFTPEGVAQARVDGSARILVVSGFWPGHGCDTLIRAMTGDAELVIVGPATDDDVRHLTEVARECGRADQVRLIGAVPHDRLPEWYRSADVLACAPDYAPTGVVPLEAMACGVPVVGYDHGCITDVVVDRVTGRLVPVGDVRTLGLTLSGVLADERGRFAYHHASVDRVRSRYTWDRTAVALDRLYHQVLGRPYQPAQETSGESPVPA